MVLALALGRSAADAVTITTLKEVEPLIIDKYGVGAAAQDKAVKELLNEGVYMPQEVTYTASTKQAAQFSCLSHCGMIGMPADKLRCGGECNMMLVVVESAAGTIMSLLHEEVRDNDAVVVCLALLANSGCCCCDCFQLEEVLGTKLDSIFDGNASALRVLRVVGPEGFHLRDRALHVFSEAGRVYAFKNVCEVSNKAIIASFTDEQAGSVSQVCTATCIEEQLLYQTLPACKFPHAV
jgi:hypothetical protein